MKDPVFYFSFIVGILFLYFVFVISYAIGITRARLQQKTNFIILSFVITLLTSFALFILGFWVIIYHWVGFYFTLLILLIIFLLILILLKLGFRNQKRKMQKDEIKKIKITKGTTYLLIAGGCIILVWMVIREISPQPVFKYARVEYSDGKIDTICTNCSTENFDTNKLLVGKTVFVLTKGLNQRGGARMYKEIVSTIHPDISCGFFVEIKKAKVIGFFESYGPYNNKSKRKFIHR